MNEEPPVYRFSDSELRALLALFRRNGPLPDALYSLNAFAERQLYQSLTISEAEQLYAGR